LLGEEVSGDRSALSPLVRAKLCGLRGRRSFGGRLRARSPARSLCGCWLCGRATWRLGGRWFPVPGPLGLGPGCGLGLVAFHRARYADREAGRNFVARRAARARAQYAGEAEYTHDFNLPKVEAEGSNPFTRSPIRLPDFFERPNVHLERPCRLRLRREVVHGLGDIAGSQVNALVAGLFIGANAAVDDHQCHVDPFGP